MTDIFALTREYDQLIEESIKQGRTAEEIAAANNWGRDKTRRILKQMVEDKALLCLRKEITDVAGRKNYTYVYVAPKNG